jgi:NAD(P)H-hydrate epimerase
MTFIGLKRGMFTGEGAARCGEVRFDALEVPARVYASQILAARRLDAADLAERLGRREATAHKGHFGHVLVIGGDLGMGGAARLAAEAAARVGAGLTSVATRPEHLAAVLGARPELMVRGIETPPDVEPLLERASVIAIGPGLGRGAWGEGLWSRALGSGLPMVIDADALGWLAQSGERRDNWVLTPHPGEAGRLLECSAAAVQEDRFAAAERLAARFGGTVVLKGAGTLVQGSGTRPPGICAAGNPGMASGGMGDVLTGVIAGLLAQGHAPEYAAELGVCLHAAAADRAAAGGERGMLAADLMPELRWLANPT